mgnify:CR=1 FL=1
MEKLERVLAWGGIRRDVAFLVISGAALLLSIVRVELLPFDPAWIAIVFAEFPLCWKQ